MSDLILLLLGLTVPALLLLGLLAGFLPRAVTGSAAIGLSGLGLLLSLLLVLARLPPAAMTLPAGPPELGLHLALDTLSGFFLVLIMLSATAIAGVQAYGGAGTRAIRGSAACVAAILITMLAGDAVVLAIGLSLACAAIWLGSGQRHAFALLLPLIVFAAISLLTPSGFAPRFETIRAAPQQMVHGSAEAILTIAGVAGLIAWPRVGRSAARDALHAGLILPAGIYLLLRLTLDFPAAAAQPFAGFLMLLTGGAIGVRQGWNAAAAREADRVATGLARGQAGLAMMGTGLALICRLSDLPTGSGDALAGTLLLASGALAGAAATQAAHAVGVSAGTYRLSRLGGLAELMPGTATALSCGLLALATVPPSLGFAGLWLLLRAIVAAPRTGGLPAQIVLAIAACCIALAGALATTAALRLAGVAILSRPRTPRGSGAREVQPVPRAILLTAGSLAALIGLLPGPFLSLLALPIMHNLSGIEVGLRSGPFGTGPGYLALPVAALIGFCTGSVLMVRHWRPREPRVAAAWLDGAETPYGLPFGDPASQSAGEGFLPSPPSLPSWRLPQLPTRPDLGLTSAQAGLWLILLGLAACLVVLALAGGGQ